MSYLFELSGILTESKTAICMVEEFPNVRPRHPPASRDRSEPVPTLPKGGITHGQETQTSAAPRRGVPNTLADVLAALEQRAQDGNGRPHSTLRLKKALKGSS
jgi:hypothetical protein